MSRRTNPPVARSGIPRVAIYVRCSADKQAEKDLSIPAQLDACRATFHGEPGQQALCVDVPGRAGDADDELHDDRSTR